VLVVNVDENARPQSAQDRSSRRPGGRYVSIPRAAVNEGYDALPPHSAKFNSERDKPEN